VARAAGEDVLSASAVRARRDRHPRSVIGAVQPGEAVAEDGEHEHPSPDAEPAYGVGCFIVGPSTRKT
jgi:hypothetical protein